MAKIQLPKRVRSNTQVASAVSTNHQITDTGMPLTSGEPSVRVWIQPASASQRNAKPNTSLANNGAQEVALDHRPQAGDLRPAGDRPGDADGQAAQDEQAGQRDNERR